MKEYDPNEFVSDNDNYMSIVAIVGNNAEFVLEKTEYIDAFDLYITLDSRILSKEIMKSFWDNAFASLKEVVFYIEDTKNRPELSNIIYYCNYKDNNFCSYNNKDDDKKDFTVYFRLTVKSEYL